MDRFGATEDLQQVESLISNATLTSASNLDNNVTRSHGRVNKTCVTSYKYVDKWRWTVMPWTLNESHNLLDVSWTSARLFCFPRNLISKRQSILIKMCPFDSCIVVCGREFESVLVWVAATRWTWDVCTWSQAKQPHPLGMYVPRSSEDRHTINDSFADTTSFFDRSSVATSMNFHSD